MELTEGDKEILSQILADIRGDIARGGPGHRIPVEEINKLFEKMGVQTYQEIAYGSSEWRRVPSWAQSQDAEKEDNWENNLLDLQGFKEYDTVTIEGTIKKIKSNIENRERIAKITAEKKILDNIRREIKSLGAGKRIDVEDVYDVIDGALLDESDSD